MARRASSRGHRLELYQRCVCEGDASWPRGRQNKPMCATRRPGCVRGCSPAEGSDGGRVSRLRSIYSSAAAAEPSTPGREKCLFDERLAKVAEDAHLAVTRWLARLVAGASMSRFVHEQTLLPLFLYRRSLFQVWPSRCLYPSPHSNDDGIPIEPSPPRAAQSRTSRSPAPPPGSVPRTGPGPGICGRGVEMTQNDSF